MGRFRRRRAERLALAIGSKLRELLDLQKRNTTVVLTLDGSAISKFLREVKAHRGPLRFPRKDPTPRLARRAREKRRNR